MNNKPSGHLLIIVFIMITFVLSTPHLMATGSPGLTETENATTSTDKDKKKTGKEKEEKKEKKTDKDKILHYEVTVTATRTKRDTFETPKPVNVVNRTKILEKAPNNITELLTDLPGVDVNGVGTNQARPVIRGVRGQRILLMEDGIRMNNSRRQQDFGEIPALVDINEVDRLEVVRGPASVLYGSDAIGGVVNIITRIPDFNTKGNEIHGNFGYRYSSADEQNKTFANLSGHIGRLGLMVGGNYRKANDYTAPGGSFGDIRLAEDAVVSDSGVKDHGLNFQLNYKISDKSALLFKYEYYHAKNAGFGFIEPELFDPASTRIQIQYPLQKFQKYSFKYDNKGLNLFFADHLGFTGYYTENQRELTMNIFVPFGIPGMPGAGVEIGSENFTDIGTAGFRLEFNKGYKSHVFTYGVDFFRDNSKNTDVNSSAVVGFGPSHPDVSTTPQVPNAHYRSLGIFFQDEIALFTRTTLILGVRYQNVNAETKNTAGLEGQPLVDSTDQTVVGAANFIYGVTDHLRLVLSVGRGFRSPNLIERFYHGVTPEGGGFQSRNTGLDAETSLNFDIGFKYRRKGIYLESTYFNNVVHDGISITATGNTVNGMPEYQNINVDKLRMRGIELLGKLYFKFGLSLSSNFTYIKSKDLGNPETPYVDTYSSKINFNVRYDDPGRLFWVSYDVRINGKQKDIILVDNPIGNIIPGFTLHSISAGVTLFRNSNFPQRIGILVTNLTNELYSEFSNASFFRPAPKRQVVLTWSTRF